MSASFTCPECGEPHKEVAVPSSSWGVFLSDEAAELLALDPGRFLDRFGLRRDGVEDLPAHPAVRCCACGWIGAAPGKPRVVGEPSAEGESDAR